MNSEPINQSHILNEKNLDQARFNRFSKKLKTNPNQN